MKNKNIVIFGASSGGQKIAKILNGQFMYFVDNDLSKEHTLCMGKSVYTPNKLLSEDKNHIFIIIYSAFSYEIEIQLNEMGFKKYEHYEIITLDDLRENVFKNRIRNLFYEYKKITFSNSYIYQPLKINNELFGNSMRNWEKRWRIIKEELINYNAKSIIDIGCAEGWFIRQASEELGCFCIGIEMDEIRMNLGELTRLHDSVERYAVVHAELDAEDLLSLPNSDVVFCLNIVHHIIYSQGLEEGKKFLNNISKIVKKALIFEMGTSEEKNMSWHEYLPNMPEGQEVYIYNLLLDSGFSNIRKIGKTPALSEKYNRLLFIAEPSR